jgi:transcriptional regulator with XRE-family HTH domain
MSSKKEFRVVLEGQSPEEALSSCGLVEDSDEFEMEEVDPPPKGELADMFKCIRKRLGYSQRKFGLIFDWSPATISRIENGDKEFPEGMTEELVSTVTDLSDWSTVDDWLLLEFLRCVKGRPTRADIDKWTRENISRINDHKAVFSRIERDEDTGEETYIFTGVQES